MLQIAFFVAGIEQARFQNSYWVNLQLTVLWTHQRVLI